MKKLSLKNAQGMLTRKEMTNIMAGSGIPWGSCIGNICINDDTCWRNCNSYRPSCRDGKCVVLS